MAYFVIPFIALIVHALVNSDVFLPGNPSAKQRTFRSYRFFIFSTLAFFIADGLWGIFSAAKFVIPSYIATYLFFSFISVTVFSWTHYVVDYLEKKNIFSKMLSIIGWIFLFVTTGLLITNIFTPIMFSFTEEGDYTAKIVRTVFYISLIVLFFLTSLYSLVFVFINKDKRLRSKHIAIFFFGIVMSASILVQVFYPLSPIYSSGLLIGLTVVRLFIATQERNDFTRELKEVKESENKKEEELTNAKQLVYVDSLTGVKSKYAYVELEERIDNLIANNQIDQFAILVIDLNDLKYTNDKLGHEKGDDYLIESARFIQSYFPDVDLYRFGGDEFVLFIEDHLYKERHTILEAFNKKVEENFETGEPILAAGMSDFIKEQDNAYRSVFERADERMYARKKYLKSVGTINISKLCSKKDIKEEINIQNIILKAQEDAKECHDPRLNFYKTFYHNERLSLIELLNNSSADEIMEVDFNNDSFKQIYHVDGKYFVPLVEISYKELYQFVIDHIVHPDDRDSYIELMNPDGFFERLKNNEIPNFGYAHFRYRLQDGDYRYVEQVVITGVENSIQEGKARIYVFDIHNLKTRQLGRVSNESNVISKGRDTVTNLLLEKEFLKKAELLIEERPNDEWCFVSLDIEHFRFFDEWYGRETGDFLLAKIGATLTDAESDLHGISGYFGKDDFALLINYDEQKIKNLYESLRSVILSFGLSAGFLPAFGVVMVEGGLSLMDAFDRASIAVSKAKEDIRHRICLYDTDMQFSSIKEYRLLSEFVKAFNNEEITFYLQPQCRISSKKIVGAEALSRWIKKDGSLVSPADYIPVLEKYGFIADLDQYIWEKVCCWIRSCLDRKIVIPPISVNVSRIDIFSIDVLQLLIDLTNKYQISPKMLKVEITETAYSENTSRIDELVFALKEKGFVVLMDDFGNGYSSLNMLSNIKVDAIKLDANFLHIEDRDSEKGIRILESVVNMAKQIALPIIVEGVENKEQCDFLENLGCRYIQGYFMYRPMPIDDFEELIQTNDIIDHRGFVAKLNDQIRIREFLDRNIYSDSMLNNIIGAVAFYSYHDGITDIVRYNEQFYQAVGVPDFTERLDHIEQFMPKEDVPKLHNALENAIDNHLNGYSEILRFYRTNGQLSSFRIHFYHLGKQEGGERFYGSATDITETVFLRDQLTFLASNTHENLIFIKKYDGALHFSVASQGLSDIFKLTPQQLEKEMNEGTSKERFVNESEYDELMNFFNQSFVNKANFTKELSFFDSDNKPVTLRLVFTYVGNTNNSIDAILNSSIVKK